MTEDETFELIVEIRRMCPAQVAVDGQTLAWFALLERFAYVDCLEAARDVVRAGARFVALGDVYQGALGLEDERRARVPREQLLPRADPDDPVAYRLELAERVRLAGLPGAAGRDTQELTA